MTKKEIKTHIRRTLHSLDYHGVIYNQQSCVFRLRYNKKRELAAWLTELQQIAADESLLR